MLVLVIAIIVAGTPGTEAACVISPSLVRVIAVVVVVVVVVVVIVRR